MSKKLTKDMIREFNENRRKARERALNKRRNSSFLGFFGLEGSASDTGSFSSFMMTSSSSRSVHFLS